MHDIKSITMKYFERIQEIRHQLHENPEIGFEEFETQKLVQAELDKLGIENEKMANTGVVGLIKGKYPGKTVLLRGDMDALEVFEEADVPFKSKIKGKMHACGHDGHTAGLLGAAMVLNEIKDDLKGNVKLMFQPAEEDQGGALPMIEAGILENPSVDAAFGLHLWGPLKRNQVCVKTGAMMAAPDSFKIRIIGKGTHAAMPHLGIDPIVIAGQIINNIQTVVSRLTNPLSPVVISICTIHGGEAFNVVPQYVELGGTIRTLDYDTREQTPILMEKIIKGIVEQYGASYEFDYKPKYPPLINDAKMSEFAKKSIGKISGDENVSELSEPSMGGEDFAYLCEKVPSAFFFVGISEEGRAPAVHHHPSFAWEDEVLIDSSSYLAQIAYDFLNEE